MHLKSNLGKLIDAHSCSIGRPEHRQNMVPNLGNSFDLLRLAAACAVLFSHSFPLAGQNSSEPIQRLTRYGSLGSLGVDIFFIISGYLVSASYLRGKGALSFFWKRSLRLFPGLWGAVLFVVCVLGPCVSNLSVKDYFAHQQTLEYLRNLFLVPRYQLPGVFEANPYPKIVNGSLWTLPLEAFMYLLVLLLGKTRLLHTWGCCVLALGFGILHFGVPSSVFTSSGVILHLLPYSELTHLGILYFVGGAFACREPLWRFSGIANLACVALLVVFANSKFAEFTLLLVLPYMVLSAAHVESKVSQAVTRAGDFSYGIYVYAFPIEQTVAMLLGAAVSPLAITALSLPVTLVLACVSWYGIERRALALKRYAYGR